MARRVVFFSTNESSPDLNKVKVARRRGALQLKVAEVQHNLHVDLHGDLEDAVPGVGVVVGVVG